MSAQRIIQNFRNSRGLLWCAAGHAEQSLMATLEGPVRKLGVQLVHIETIDTAALDPSRDILLLDADGDLGAAGLLAPGITLPPVPVVGLVGVEAPSRLKALVDLGATSFLRKPVHAAAVYSALFLAVNGHRRLSEMARRIADHDRRRGGRRFIVKAVLHLVTTRGMTDDEAYELLRRESMRSRQGIEEYCEAVVASTMVARDTHPEQTQETLDAKRIAQDGGIVSFADVADDGRAGGRSDQDRRAGGSVG